MGSVDQIFTLKQIGEKAREKIQCVYVSFIDLVNTVNREGFLQVLIMYYEGEGGW